MPAHEAGCVPRDRIRFKKGSRKEKVCVNRGRGQYDSSSQQEMNLQIGRLVKQTKASKCQ